ncbi:MAG: anti-sigma factor family protein [Alkalispirochaetaceae bacterium]
MCRDHYLLSAYVDGELDQREREKLEARLQDEPSLEAARRRMLALRSAMHAEQEPDYEAISRGLWERVAALPRRRRVSLWERRVTVPLPVAAAAAVVILLMAGMTFFLALRGATGPAAPLAGMDPNQLDITIQIENDQAEDLIRWLEEREDVQQVTIELPEAPRFELIGEPMLVPASEARGPLQ